MNVFEAVKQNNEIKDSVLAKNYLFNSPSYKFDSTPELVLARVLENDGDAQNWLRPAPIEFNNFAKTWNDTKRISMSNWSNRSSYVKVCLWR